MILLSLMLIPAVHYLADFELQDDWMALNKSKKLWPLTAHILVYAGVFALVFGPLFGVITFVTHWLTDYLTSRWTSKLWFLRDVTGDRGDRLGDNEVIVEVLPTRHRFFCGIGVDQMVHQYCLLVAVLWLDPTPFLWWLPL